MSKESGVTQPDKSAAGSKSVFQRNPQLASMMVVAGLVVVLGAALIIRQQLDLRSKGSQAGCYGYGCQSSVSLGARPVGYGKGSPWSYGTLNVNPGQSVELRWNGQNVDRCRADFTKYSGTNYAPTVYGKPIQKNTVFEVECLRNNTVVAKSTLQINVGRGPKR